MVFSGRIDQLDQELRDEIDLFEKATVRGDRLTVVVCLNYGGRQEIVDGINRLLRKGFAGEITEELISANLYRPGIPDPDLVIRTSGEVRISNFLLWESAYAEFFFTDTLWPDFGEEDLEKALEYSPRGGDMERGSLFQRNLSCVQPAAILGLAIRGSTWQLLLVRPAFDMHDLLGSITG